MLTPLISTLSIIEGTISGSTGHAGLVDADTRMTCTDSAEDAHYLPFWAGQVIDAVEAAGAYSVTIEFTGEIEF